MMTKQSEMQVTEAVDLEKLAAEINASHVHCLGAARTTLTHAVKTGELLIEAKTEVPRGEWEPWVEANCQFSLREAQRYMKIARDLEKLQKEGLDTTQMTLTEVLGHLRNSKPKSEIATTGSDEANTCFQLSPQDREQRLRRFEMSPPALPETVTDETQKIVDNTVAHVRRAIRSGVLKQIQPKIEDGSVEPADMAIFLFEELRSKLSIAVLFDEPQTQQPAAESNGRHIATSASKLEAQKETLGKIRRMRATTRL